MKRFSVLLLLLALVLVGCSERFTVADGGYLDEETGGVYRPLSDAFEAIAAGEAIGAWESRLYDDVLTFHEIVGADATRFLSDEKGNVYCTDETEPDAGAWSVKQIFVCEETAVSVAVGQIADADVIAKIRTLWHEGEQTELPYSGLTVSRRLKMVSDDCPGIYYCVRYFIYEDGTAYFYDRFEDRAVLVSAELMQKIPIT